MLHPIYQIANMLLDKWGVVRFQAPCFIEIAPLMHFLIFGKKRADHKLFNFQKGSCVMAKKKERIPQYGTVMRKGNPYYRTRITDADGKHVSLYAVTCEELYHKELEARRQVEEIIFHRKNPTVAEYCERWLLMQSAKVSSATLRGYTFDMNNYIVKPLGDMYLSDVTADDIRLALIPASGKRREGGITARR